MKKKIALVTGGYSGESVVSYKTVKTIDNNLDRELFDVFIIDINPTAWEYVAADGSRTPVNKADFSILHEGVPLHFDAVFLAMHGTPGEDGKLQGYFDLLQIPYSSCSAAALAVTFNKRYTVAVANFSGINVAKSAHLFKEQSYDIAQLQQQLQLPLFVKPNNGGSSIGMSKVNRYDELAGAIEKAFKEDNQVLIEEFIKGREFTIGVFKTEGEIITLPMTEVVALNEFFDFNAKYEGKSKETTPAELEEHKAEKIRAAAKKVYQIFNCKGVVRIDFIYNEEKDEPYMLEVNTIPGQSEASIVPQQVKAMGWTLKEFYTKLVLACWE